MKLYVHGHPMERVASLFGVADPSPTSPDGLQRRDYWLTGPVDTGSGYDDDPGAHVALPAGGTAEVNVRRRRSACAESRWPRRRVIH